MWNKWRHVALSLALLAGISLGCEMRPPDPIPPDPPPTCQTDPSLCPPPGPTYTDTGERGALRTQGIGFLREDGSAFSYRGFTGFRLYEQWLIGKVGITPTVENWVSCGGQCLPGRGPNVIRVLGMVDSFAHLWPQENPEYYSQLRPFADYVWNTWHVRIEFVVFADSQIIMPDANAQQIHLKRVQAELAGHPAILFEIANEPFKNITGGAARAFELGQSIKGLGNLVASGSYEALDESQLDYVVVHTPRDAEWPRKSKDLYDFRVVQGKPVVGDEPMGGAEAERPGSRSTNEDDFAQYAASSVLFAAGATYHGDAGINFQHLGPVETRLAAAFYQGLMFMPPIAQFGAYNRGTDSGGCQWIGEPFVEHSDSSALRTFATALGQDGYVVQFRSLLQPVACSGWTVVEVPRPGLVHLKRR